MRILKRLHDFINGWKLLDFISTGDSGGSIEVKPFLRDYRMVVLVIHPDELCDYFKALETSFMENISMAFNIA